MEEINQLEDKSTDAGLGLQDLITLAQIIQLATNRATWRTEELTTVGGVYDKLIAFLDAAGVVEKNNDLSETQVPAAVSKGE